MITGAHLRMIRGALRLSVRQVAEMAGLSKSTVFELEHDIRRVHGGTLEKIRDAFAPYVEFVEPVEGVRGAGIIMKWGIEPIGEDPREQDGATTGKSGDGLSLAAWDDFGQDAEFAGKKTDSRMRSAPRCWLTSLGMMSCHRSGGRSWNGHYTCNLLDDVADIGPSRKWVR